MNEKERVQELIAYQILDTAPETELNELAEIASAICNTPISLITMIDASRQWFKVNSGLDMSETPREDSFCQYALQHSKEVLVVNDTLGDKRFENNPYVKGNPNIRFYAGAPLETPNGNVLGTLCILDRKPRSISEKQKRALQLLAKKAMDYLNSRKLILEQKEHIEFSALKLKKLTDQAPGIIYQLEMTQDGKISFDFISKGIANLHPKLDPEVLKNSPRIALSVIHPDDIPVLRKSIRNSFDSLTEWIVEYRVISDNGEEEWHLGRGKPEKLDNGSVVWYGTFQNINNRVEYEKAMEQIAFDISHVLRKPVATLLGLTSLLGEEEVDETTIREYGRHIKTVSEELEQFTRKLNDTYRLKKAMIIGQNIENSNK